MHKVYKKNLKSIALVNVGHQCPTSWNRGLMQLPISWLMVVKMQGLV